MNGLFLFLNLPCYQKFEHELPQIEAQFSATGYFESVSDTLTFCSIAIYFHLDEHTLNMMAPSESPTPSESMPTVEVSNKVLVSLGLFFSMGRKGYLYELFSAPRLLTEYDFTETCISACLTRSFLHVITKNGLETYTTRLYSSASLAAKSYHGEDDVEFIRQCKS